MKNQIKITEEQAKQLLKTNKELSDEIFNAFPQLKPKPIVFKSWEDLEEISGHYLSVNSRIMQIYKANTEDGSRNVFATEKQCLSMLAYAQLTQLMKATGDCEVDWKDDNTKWCLCLLVDDINENHSINILAHTDIFHFIAFNTLEIANEFKNTHVDLIKQFFQL